MLRHQRPHKWQVAELGLGRLWLEGPRRGGRRGRRHLSGGSIVTTPAERTAKRADARSGSAQHGQREDSRAHQTQAASASAARPAGRATSARPATFLASGRPGGPPSRTRARRARAPLPSGARTRRVRAHPPSGSSAAARRPGRLPSSARAHQPAARARRARAQTTQIGPAIQEGEQPAWIDFIGWIRLQKIRGMRLQKIRGMRLQKIRDFLENRSLVATAARLREIPRK